jgi:hypothetical protein
VISRLGPSCILRVAVGEALVVQSTVQHDLLRWPCWWSIAYVAVGMVCATCRRALL